MKNFLLAGNIKEKYKNQLQTHIQKSNLGTICFFWKKCFFVIFDNQTKQLKKNTLGDAPIE